MWLTDGEKYVNLDNCRSLSIERSADEDFYLVVDGKPEFRIDNDHDIEKVIFRFYKMMTKEGGPYSQKVLNLSDCGMIEGQFLNRMNDYDHKYEKRHNRRLAE
jgi:hypothetical protein